MKAAVMRGIGNINVEDVAEPEPGPDQVKVKVAYCGICGTDPEQLEAINKRFESLRAGKPHVYGKEVGEGPGRQHFIIRLIPLADEDGHVRRFIGSAADITELKRSESELKRHNPGVRSGVRKSWRPSLSRCMAVDRN